MLGKDTPAERRRFLGAELRRRKADCAIVSHPKHVFYLTGFPTNLNMWYSIMKGPRSTSFLVVDSEGRGALLIGKTELASYPAAGGLDLAKKLELGFMEYSDYSLTGGMVTYGNRLAAELKGWLSGLDCRFDHVAVEDWHFADSYRGALNAVHPDAHFSGISEFLLAIRNSKGEDEIRYIKKATEIIDFAYGVAKQNVKAGRSELDVYGEINSRAFREYGPFAWVVGDYASGERSISMGGMPTPRKLENGNTFIFDLQASHNNYWADLCRTFTVGKSPSKAQRDVLSVLQKAKRAAEEVLLPGTRGKEVYEAVNSVIVKAGHTKLPHHAGHCIGLDDQEPPWFIPVEERSLEKGSVCVVEPGIYETDSGGIRIEDQYLITEKGPRKLSHFPLNMS